MKKSKLAYGVAGVVSVAGLALVASPVLAKTTQPDPSVMVFDQSIGDSKVTVDYARMTTPGYLVVYKSDKDGLPKKGKPLGYTALEPGYHSKIGVSLKQEPKQGDRLWVALYKDADQNPSFDPAAGDKPIWERQEIPAQNSFLIR